MSDGKLRARDSTSVAAAEAAHSSSAFAGAQYLMGLQLFVRLATFSTNAVAFRLAGSSAFGVASIKLELLLSTILFLSRESIRNALLRIEPAEDKQRPSVREQRIINAALVSIGVGGLLAGALYMVYGGNSQSSIPYYSESIAAYVLAAWVELLVEPLYVLSRSRVLFQLQARCESIAVSTKCAIVALVLLLGNKGSDRENKFRLLAFALGQLGYAAGILLSYSWSMKAVLGYPVAWCYMPKRVSLDDGFGFVGCKMRSLIAVFMGQSLLKHVLTQGDSMVMSRIARDSDMGVFALVSNYASIPARILFLPLEEAARAVFTRSDARTSMNVLTTLAKLQLLLGCLFCVFGGLYAPVVMPLIDSKGGSANARVLSAYFMYLPMMGLNGFLEAFAHSVATKQQLLRVNIWMAGCSAVYISLSVLLLGKYDMGALGMVMANMVNMALRIAYCCWFARKWFISREISLPGVSRIAPHPVVLVSSLIAGVLSVVLIRSIDQTAIINRLAILALGSALGLAVLFAMWILEKPFIQAAKEIKAGSVIDKKRE
ncbi:Oligosaccharide translocation protein rft1 [Coemansia sp. RSA 485]|nr:Oligosaccharide translocation protein rft1 [Coemansia sp. RSA 485]